MGNKQQPRSRGETTTTVGKSMIPEANQNADKVCWAIGEAERIKGSPPLTPEVVTVFHHNYTREVPRMSIFGFLLQLYREDFFYADK